MISPKSVDDQPLKHRRVLLGVTGSIAAYKAADIASRLGHLGADVHVVMTRSAREFVGPATFRGITLNPVLSDVFDEPYEQKVAHIQIAQESDLILIAPATADMIAKMAHGIADDLLSTALLAATASIMIAPAMNTAMLEHPATQANLKSLSKRGVILVDPSHGVLACRTEGYGKLADVEDVVQAVVDRIGRKGDYSGIRVLVTAGATREPLDPVRFISNRSSGRMGFALAEAASERGAYVTLITGPSSLQPPCGVDTIRVETTEEMLSAACDRFADCDLFIAAAAPADYGPESQVRQKRKKAGDSWTIRLRETPDIVGTLAGKKRRNQIVVGFAAETEDMVKNAAGKLKRKKLDLIVANDVTAEGAGFDVDTNIVTLLWPDGRSESVPKLPKRVLADRLLTAALSSFNRTR